MTEPVDRPEPEFDDPDATVSVWHAGDVTSELSPAEGITTSAATASSPSSSTESLPGYWQPDTRLSGRVNAPVRPPRSAESRAWWIAAIIVFTALLIAVGLWLAALWIQSNDEPDAPDQAGMVTAVVEVPVI